MGEPLNPSVQATGEHLGGMRITPTHIRIRDVPHGLSQVRVVGAQLPDRNLVIQDAAGWLVKGHDVHFGAEVGIEHPALDVDQLLKVQLLGVVPLVVVQGDRVPHLDDLTNDTIGRSAEEVVERRPDHEEVPRRKPLVGFDPRELQSGSRVGVDVVAQNVGALAGVDIPIATAHVSVGRCQPEDPCVSGQREVVVPDVIRHSCLRSWFSSAAKKLTKPAPSSGECSWLTRRWPGQRHSAAVPSGTRNVAHPRRGAVSRGASDGSRPPTKSRAQRFEPAARPGRRR